MRLRGEWGLTAASCGEEAKRAAAEGPANGVAPWVPPSAAQPSTAPKEKEKKE